MLPSILFDASTDNYALWLFAYSAVLKLCYQLLCLVTSKEMITDDLNREGCARKKLRLVLQYHPDIRPEGLIKSVKRPRLKPGTLPFK